MTKIFDSIFPIIALPMNQVSDIPFAIACADAGIYPSVSVSCYQDPYTLRLDYKRLIEDMKLFKKEWGDSRYVFSMPMAFVLDRILLKILVKFDVKMLEILTPIGEYDKEAHKINLKNLRKLGFMLSMRALVYDKNGYHNGAMFSEYDVVFVKGDRAAGAIGTQTLEEIFFIAKNDFPNVKFIPCGGIATRARMDFFLQTGAEAVGIGTLFAASKESKLSNETKLRMTQTSFEEIRSHSYDGKNALVFKDLHESDWNKTNSLRIGIKRPDLGGHVYAGSGVNEIDSIRSLKDIVADFT